MFYEVRSIRRNTAAHDNKNVLDLIAIYRSNAISSNKY